MKPLAILGGTFDPVHIGHLRVAWEAAEALDAEVRLMPAHVPPHRPQPQASAAHRVAMLRLALAGQSRLALDERELSRPGPSYTVDTLRELRREIGSQRPLLLLVGADAYAGLPSWHDWLELYALAHLVVLTRPGHAVEWSGVLALETRARRVGTTAALHEAPSGPRAGTRGHAPGTVGQPPARRVRGRARAALSRAGGRAGLHPRARSLRQRIGRRRRATPSRRNRATSA